MSKNISFSCLPVGGKFQFYWPNFLADVSVIVYAIDSSASERFDESKNALLQLLSEDTLKEVPLLLLACKQDAEGAKPTEDIASRFGLQELCSTRKVRIGAIEILGNGEARGVQEAKELILNFCANIPLDSLLKQSLVSANLRRKCPKISEHYKRRVLLVPRI